MTSPTDHRISPEAQALAEEYFGFAQKVARQVISRRNFRVSVDDAVQAGAIGLLSAAENFDPQRGVPFEAYARRRIQGAILDYVRGESGMARSIRVRAAEIEAAEARVAARLLRKTIDLEFEYLVAEELGVSAGKLDEIRRHIASSRTVSLESTVSDAPLDTQVALTDGTSLEDDLLRHEEFLSVIAAMEALSDRERTILIRHYVQEIPMVEIASTMGVTPTRVGTIRNRALKKIRQTIAEGTETDAV